MDEHSIILLGVNQEMSSRIGQELREEGCRLKPVDTLEACLSAQSGKEEVIALIIDLDTMAVDDHFLHQLYQSNRKCPVIVLSSRSFHIELKEAMRRNIFAVLRKPSSNEELRICLKALLETKTNH
ncbi:MAG: response regulator [Desulfohalobiaceae bacterium]|nr:response regulator [Desulfohalobiaceae bacterium]